VIDRRRPPVSAGELLENALEIYREHVIVLLTIAAVMVVPARAIGSGLILLSRRGHGLGVLRLGGKGATPCGPTTAAR